MPQRKIATVVAWDDEEARLESRIGAIAADLVVAGEAPFRRGLVEQREWKEQMESWRVERRRAEIKHLEETRLTQLKESGALSRAASEIRTIVEAVKHAIGEGGLAIESAQLRRLQNWATAQADRLDPVMSGQVLSHLIVPELADLSEPPT